MDEFSRTPPDRANELFEKLLATSDNCGRKRASALFADLKEELELLAYPAGGAPVSRC